MPSNMRPRPPAQRRRQIRRDFMGWFNVYGSFRQIIQDLIAPSLEAIQGKLEAINSKVDALNVKFDARIEALDAKIEALDAKIESTRSSLDAKIESLRAEVHGLRGEFQELRLDVRQKWEQSLEVHERLAAVEAKLEIR